MFAKKAQPVRMSLLSILVMAAVSWVSPAQADIILLQNGSELNGEIQSEDADQVIIKHNGMDLKISKVRIREIVQEKAESMALRRAKELEEQNDHEKALVHYIDAMRQSPGDRSAREGRHRCGKKLREAFREQHADLLSKKDFDALREVLRSKIEALPEGSPERFMLEHDVMACLLLAEGNVHLDRLRLKQAEQCLEEAARLNPEDCEAHYALGRFYCDESRWEEANAVFSDLAQSHPHQNEIQLEYLKTLFMCGKYEAGLAVYEGFNHRSLIREEQERFEQFVGNFGSWIGQAYRDRAVWLEQQGNRGEAFIAYKKGTSFPTTDLKTLRRDAMYFKRMGATGDYMDTEAKINRIIARQQEKGIVASSGAIRAVSYASAKSQAARTGRNIMLLFTTEWCGYCKQLKNNTLPDPEAKAALKNYVLLELDAEKGEGVRMADRYGVSGYPTMVLLNSSGQQIKKLSGYMPPSTFAYTLYDAAGVKAPNGTKPREMQDSITIFVQPPGM